MNCEARKGFLTLSSCENPAATSCANCARSLCPMHLAPPDFTMCLDCAATQRPAEQTEEGGDEYDEVWSHRYRSSYYDDTGYRSGSSTYYDSQDVRSFDEREGDGFGDETERGGFGES
jgi:hypothetical protein